MRTGTLTAWVLRAEYISGRATDGAAAGCGERRTRELCHKLVLQLQHVAYDIQRDVLCNIQHDTSPQDRSTAVPRRMQYHVCTARSDGDGGGGGGGGNDNDVEEMRSPTHAGRAQI